MVLRNAHVLSSLGMGSQDASLTASVPARVRFLRSMFNPAAMPVGLALFWGRGFGGGCLASSAAIIAQDDTTSIEYWENANMGAVF